MWKSEVQCHWEEEAKKIGITTSTKSRKENLFVDYWELPWGSKVEDLEEVYPPKYTIKFCKKITVQRKKKSPKNKWTHKKGGTGKNL